MKTIQTEPSSFETGWWPLLEIDDAEAPHADRDAVAQVDAFVVRPAVDHGAAHGADLVFENGALIPANDPGNATHEQFSLFLVRLKPDTLQLGRPAPVAGAREASARHESSA